MIDAVRVPTAAGVNLTLTWQLAFTARLPGQLFVCGANSETSFPLTKMLRMLRGEPPVLVSVTLWIGLAVATTWLPKLMFPGERFATPDVPVPVPLRSTF